MIARLKKISVSAVRRDAARALGARPVEAPVRFVALRMARPDKAQQTVDEAMEDGNLAAIEPFLKIMAGLDRYHGLATRLATSIPCHEALSAPATPPLALPRAEPQSGHETTLNSLNSNER